MINEPLLQFATWLQSQAWTQDLHGSFYLYNWIESLHVMTLMLSLGTLCVIDLRMLGVCFTKVPASRLAARLTKPMYIGFALMFASGVLLFSAIPVRTTQSVWFRLKFLLLIAAAINAWAFHRYMNNSASAWDTAPKPPTRARLAAALSLAIWAGVVTTGRFIAYDWYDCGQKTNGAFVNWAAGCNVSL